MEIKKRLSICLLLFISLLMVSAELKVNPKLFEFDRRVDNDFLKPYCLAENPDYFSNFYAIDIAPYPAGNFYYGIGIDKNKNLAYYFNTNNQTGFFAVDDVSRKRALLHADKVAVTSAGELYIIDAVRKQVWYWSIGGDHYEPDGILAKDFANPEDLYWDNGVLYILDNESCCLYKFSTVLKSYLNFQSGGLQLPAFHYAQFTSPSWGKARGVAVWHGFIFVVFEAGAILKLTTGGDYLADFKIGRGNLGLAAYVEQAQSQSWLKSIAIGPFHNLYVLDTAARKIHVFNQELAYLASWSDPAHPVESTATDICFTPGQNYFFLSHPWGFYIFKIRPQLADISLSHDFLYPALTGDDYRGLQVELAVIGSGNLDLDVVGDGNVYSLLKKHYLFSNSHFTWQWDGKLPDNTFIPAGNCTLRFFLGNQLQAEMPLRIKNPPGLELPAPDGVVLSDLKPENEYFFETTGSGIVRITMNPLAAAGSQAPVEQVLYETALQTGFHSYFLRQKTGGRLPDDGCYELNFYILPPELRQSQIARTKKSLYFFIDNRELTLGEIFIEQPAFSPVATHNVEIAASFSLSEPARVTLDVLDNQATTVSTLIPGRYLPGGTIRAAWDGSLPGGQLAPDGVYCLRVTATQENPPLTISQSSGLFALDTMAPRLTSGADGGPFFLSPDEPSSIGLNDQLTWEFAFSEPANGCCEIINGNNDIVYTQSFAELADGCRFTWNGRTAGGYAADGRYWLRISLQDNCGNSAESFFAVIVDNNRMATPAAGSAETLYASGTALVNDQTPALRQAPSLAYAANTLFAVWAEDRQDGSGSRIYGRLLTPDGAAAGAVFPLNPATGPREVCPLVTPFREGFLVAWWSRANTAASYQLHARRFNPAGDPLSQVIELAAQSEGHIDPSDNSLTLCEWPNGFAVAWENDSGLQRRIMIRLFDAAGNPVAVIPQVPDDTDSLPPDPLVNQSAPRLFTWNGDFYLSWCNHRGGYPYSLNCLQPFDYSGNPAGPLVVLDTDYYGQAKVIIPAGRNLVSVWSDLDKNNSLPDYKVYFTLYDKSFRSHGTAIAADPVSAGSQFTPLVCPLDDGFVLAWWTSAGCKINLRRFDGNGLPVGGLEPVDCNGYLYKALCGTATGFALICTADDTVCTSSFSLRNLAENPNLTAAILQPAARSFATNTDFSISGTAADLNFAKWELWIAASGGSPAGEALLLQTGTTREFTYPLQLFAYPDYAEYTVQLKAFDKAGNTAADSFRFTRAPAGACQLIREFAFAENRDVSCFTAAAPPAVSFALHAAADVLLEISSRAGTPFNSLSFTDVTAVAKQTLDLTGYPDGEYKIRLQADYDNVFYEATLEFTVDNTPPQIAFDTLQSVFSGEQVVYPFDAFPANNVIEANPALLSLELAAADGTPISGIIRTAQVADLPSAFFSPRLLDAGVYQLIFTVTDLTGHTARAVHPFTIEAYEVQLQFNAPDLNKRQHYTILFDVDVLSQSAITAYRVRIISPTLDEVAAGSGSHLSFTVPSSLYYPGQALDAVLEFTIQDALGNTHTLYRTLFVDNALPAIHHIINGPSLYIDGSLVIGPATGLSLFTSSGDNLSRVVNTRFRINSGPWEEYSGELFFPAAGSYLLLYYCRDSGENQSTTGAVNFIVDATPPEIGDLADCFSGAVYATAATLYTPGEIGLAITPVDPAPYASGVDKVFYKTNNGSFTEYDWQTGATLNLITDTAATLTVQVTDRVGNARTQTTVFAVDGIPPVTRYAATGSSWLNEAGGMLFLGDNSLLSLAATDPGAPASGVAAVYYSLDDSPWGLYTAPLGLSGENPVTLKYFGVDNTGNAEIEHTLRLAGDRSPPVLTLIPDGPFVRDGQVLYADNMLSVTITAVDEESGIEGIYYRFDEWDILRLRENRLYLPNKEMKLTCYASNYLGNNSVQHYLVVDKSPPVTVMTGDLPLSPRSYGYYAEPGITCNWSASGRSPVASTLIILNGTPQAAGSLAYTFSQSGVYKLTYSSTDILGHTETAHTLLLTVGTLPVLGDVNGDRQVTIIDALMIAQYTVGLIPPGIILLTADVSCDGIVDILDALMIAHYYVGNLAEFPCGLPESGV